MTIIYNTATINGRLNVVISNIDAGPSFGQMRLLSSAGTSIALIPLQKPSGTVSGGVLTFSGTPLAASIILNSGQITAADIEDSTSTVVASGLTVGPSTSFDIVMSNPIVSSGQALSLTFASITGQ